MADALSGTFGITSHPRQPPAIVHVANWSVLSGHTVQLLTKTIFNQNIFWLNKFIFQYAKNQVQKQSTHNIFCKESFLYSIMICIMVQYMQPIKF